MDHATRPPSAIRNGARVGALALALALALGCPQSYRPSQAASVNGRAIPIETLRRGVEARLAERPDAPLGELVSEALDALIRDELLLGRAEELGIEVSPDEVAERIRLLHGENFSGSSEEYRAQVRTEMLMQRAELMDLAGALEVSEEELRQRFERVRERYDQPKRARIRHIVIGEEEKAKELRTRLVAGADFEALAREFSLGPEASEGGLLPPYAAGELPEVFDHAFQIKPEQPSRVLESPHGYHILLVLERIPARTAEFETVREQILGELRRERLAELRPEWIRGLRKRAEIDVSENLLEDL